MKDLERVAQFYNEYQVINFGDEKAMKSQGKVFMKQMNELVDIVIPCLVRIGTKESKEFSAYLPITRQLRRKVSITQKSFNFSAAERRDFVRFSKTSPRKTSDQAAHSGNEDF